MRQGRLGMGFALVFAAGCGGGGGGGGGSGSMSTTPSNLIQISSYTFSPANLTVAPGATVTVRNNDGFSHTVTSESTAGAYTPGAVNGVSFDTGNFTGDTTFTIPANATSGTVVPYYCRIHTTMMNAAQITIQSGATSSPSPTPTPTPMPGPY